MKHAGNEALAQLALVIDAVRGCGALVERSPGCFYLRSRAFLHFHQDAAGLFADLKDEHDAFERHRITTPAEQKAFVTRVVRQLQALPENVVTRRKRASPDNASEPTGRKAVKENKTKATDASVVAYLAAIEDPAARQDCSLVVQLMSKITGQPPVMWGPTIVGFGSYHYTYASGREGDACIAGFASRKPNICVYLLADSDRQQALLAKLGKHRMTKACLYVRRLSDIDIKVLENLIAASAAEVGRRYGGTSRRSA